MRERDGGFLYFMEKVLLILQVVSTLYLTGLIWIIQVVQYPFFSHLEKADFVKYHDAYRFWITPVVAPAMLVELFSAILIVFFPPAAIDFRLLIVGLILAVIVWISTFFIQVPLHEKLAAGFDADAHRALVRTNWIRTAAWSLRAALMAYALWKIV